MPKILLKDIIASLQKMVDGNPKVCAYVANLDDYATVILSNAEVDKAKLWFGEGSGTLKAGTYTRK